mgnify:FL=1
MSDAESGAASLRDILRIDSNTTFTKEIYGETEDTPSNPCGILWDLIDPNLASSVSERLQEIKLSLEEMNEQILNTKLNGRFVNKLKGMKPEISSIVFDELASWYPEDLIEIQYKRSGASTC